MEPFVRVDFFYPTQRTRKYPFNRLMADLYFGILNYQPAPIFGQTRVQPTCLANKVLGKYVSDCLGF